jgi:hypothetical protein
MLKESTIIKFDINGFNAVAQSGSPQETASYLRSYYDHISASISGLGWKIVKTIGDCVLVSAEQNATQENISVVCKELRNSFDISTYYRACHFEEAEYSYDDYSCKDVIGKDINNLFMEDNFTFSVS